jgi:hypothetical protein
MVDLSSSLDEEGSIADTSRDLEFTKCLYGELNRALLGPPSDRKIIILSDSDEEKEEVHEEKSSGAGDVTTPAAINPASTASAKDVDAPTGAKNDNSDDQGSNLEAGGEDGGRDDTGEP